MVEEVFLVGFAQDKYVLFVDSQNAIHLGKNPTFHNRSKTH